LDVHPERIVVGAFGSDCDTEISDFGVELRIEEDIARLNISMRDAILVHEGKTTRNSKSDTQPCSCS